MFRRARNAWPILLISLELGCRQPTAFLDPARHIKPFVDVVVVPDLSASTRSLLSSQGIADLATHYPSIAFFALEQRISSNTVVDSHVLLALAELADRVSRKPMFAGKCGDPLSWSRDAAVYAAFCLSDPQSNEPTRRIACAVHNRAVARCLRFANTSSYAAPSDWTDKLAKAGIIPTAGCRDWQTFGFDRIQLAEDLLVAGGIEREPQQGVGVPVLARRRLNGDEKEQWKPYGPSEISFAATAMIHASGSSTPTNWRAEPVELVLHNPVSDDPPPIGDGTFPVAEDLTTVLVSRLNDRRFRFYEHLSVVAPSYYLSQAGIYTLDSYQPGKIPFLLIQGLWSSPNVWSPMISALRSDPVLRENYQFWVILYPSGYVPPLAANAIRRSIEEIRERFDPTHQDLALDRMVVIGKSSGGLFAKMLVQSSGSELWNSVFAMPLKRIKAEEPLRSQLSSMFFYEPLPSVTRVIFLSTGHRGSNLANKPGVRLIEQWIHAGDPTLHARDDLIRDNGREIFQTAYQDRAMTTNDGLNGQSPLLRAIDRTEIAPSVAYHSIIGNIRNTNSLELMNDGVISYNSAHIEGAESEKVTTMRHASEANAEVIAEVRRILHSHLDELAFKLEK